MVPLTRPAWLLTAVRKLAASHEFWAAAALFLAALALRLYRLNANPLWLDELYGVQLSRLGLRAILLNSLTDPHPPLYYLMLWLGSGFGATPFEWAYRWLSVLAGAATVPLVYGLARRVAGPAPAAGAALVLLLSPAHLYYSQEARAYALTAGVAALSSWLLVTERFQPPGRWRLWAVVTVGGLLLDYSYVMVAGIQALFVLGLARRQAGAWPALVGAGAGLAAVAPLAARTLSAWAGAFAGEPLRLWTTAQALTAGEVARYGLDWDHTWLAGGLALLVALGVWRLARRPGDGWVLYPAAQLLLPLGAFFIVVSPLAHINLHLYQTRQFLVLLPAAFGVVAAGLAQVPALLPTRFGRRPAVVVQTGLLVALLLLSYPGLSRYWGHTKSPEGWVARFVRDQGAAGTAIISLHISLDAAFSVYVPDAAAYFTKPLNTPDGLYFADALSVQLRDWATLTRPHPTIEISRYPRRWLAWEMGVSDDLVSTLTAGCTPVPGATAEFRPFKVVLFENCPSL